MKKLDSKIQNKKIDLITIISILFIFAALLVNKWVVDYVLSVFANRIMNNHHLSVLLFNQALLFILGVCGIARHKIKPIIKDYLSQYNKKIFLFILILSLPNLLFWIIGAYKLDLSIISSIGIVSLIFKFLSSFIVISIVLFIFTFRRIKSLVVFFVIYFTLIVAETILIYYANERLEAKYLRNVIGADYSSYPILLVVGAYLFLIVTVTALVYMARNLKLKNSLRYPLVLLLVYLSICFTPIHKSVAFSLNLFSKSVTRHLAVQESTLYHYLNDGPIIRLARVLINSRSGRFKKAKLEDKREYLKLENYENTNLGTRPYNKIIMVTMESVSSSLLKLYQDLTPSLMPNIKQLQKEFTSIYLRNTSKPTNNALTSIYCSHPNVELLLRMNYPNSFVKILKENGYITAYYRSDPEYYDFGTLYLPIAGFEIHRGRAFFDSIGYHQYISNWGVPDRITFNEAIKFLQENNDKKMFLQIMCSDTHLPDGRTEYNDLKYPELPDWIKKDQNREYLKSIYFNDYDIGHFIQQLESQKIYDEDTLIIVTADHAPPLGVINQKISDIKIEMDTVPLIFLSKRKIPEFRNLEYSCQLDIAPTILHLNNIKIPVSYWGTSLFELNAKNTLEVSFFKENLVIKNRLFNHNINIFEPADMFEKQLVRIYNSQFE